MIAVVGRSCCAFAWTVVHLHWNVRPWSCLQERLKFSMQAAGSSFIGPGTYPLPAHDKDLDVTILEKEVGSYL
jgi:hypothetical protein